MFTHFSNDGEACYEKDNRFSMKRWPFIEQVQKGCNAWLDRMAEIDPNCLLKQYGGDFGDALLAVLHPYVSVLSSELNEIFVLDNSFDNEGLTNVYREYIEKDLM